MDDLADGQLGVDLRSSGLFLIACACLAIAWFCLYKFKRGRPLKAVRSSLRENIRALPALRSPATLFLLTFGAILTVALTAHLGEFGAATVLDRGDTVMSLVTATILATTATVGVRIIIKVAPEVARFIATMLARLTGPSTLVLAFATKTMALHSFAAWSPPLFSRPPPLPL